MKNYTKEQQHIISLLETREDANIKLAEQLCKGQKIDFDELLEEVFTLSFFAEAFPKKIGKYKQKKTQLKHVLKNGYLKNNTSVKF